MKKNYIRLNNNDNHLSIGNLFRIIRDLSINKRAALQSELFCTLFEIENINDTTVNNYCVGCRSISDEYKQIYINKEINYNKNSEVFIDIVLNLLTILEGKIIKTEEPIDYINSSLKMMELCNKLYNLAKNDKSVKESFVTDVYSLISINDLYNCIVKLLLYIVLYKVQPVYEDDLKTEIIESFISDTSISSNNLKAYLSIKLREGINYDNSMKKLAASNNAYACYDLGIEECYGNVSGHPRYDVAYNYLKKAANQNHASSCFVIGYLYTEGLIGNKSNADLKKGYDYLIKSNELGNIYSYNTIGNMYFNGTYPLEKNLVEARKYYEKAAEYDLAFAYNNLGKLEELNNNIEKAYEYYLKSADLGESWACNKMGEYYRKKNDFKLAFKYYNLGLDSNHRTLYSYNYYNLAKYFYLNGCSDVVLVSDKEKAISYFEMSESLIESLIELFLIYYNDYYSTNDEYYYKKMLTLKLKIESHDKFNLKYKNIIEDKIKIIKKRLNIDI